MSRRTAVFLALLGALHMAPRAGAYSGGIYNSAGCSCHQPATSTNVQVTTAVPSRFVPGASHDVGVTVRCAPSQDPAKPACPPAAMTLHQGGFNLTAPAGTFLSGSNYAVSNPTSGSPHANHNAKGSFGRSWTVGWQGPNDCATKSVTFTTLANAVDGSSSPRGDAWNFDTRPASSRTVLRAPATPGTKPAITLTNPRPSGIYNGDSRIESPGPTVVSGSVTLTALASDDSGIQSVTFTDTSVAGTATTLGGTRSPEDGRVFTAVLTTTLQVPGPHTITATAKDCQGLTSTTSLDVIMIP
ncbi:MAG: hypothetical protein QOD06_1361 [Candidatus Binatota bacterium]|nr:hypothetical protein [Candidatus Binatota bacterium]